MSQDFKTENPQIQWRDIKDFRNKMVHDYTGTDNNIVWEIVSNYIGELEFQIQELLK